MDHQIFNSKLSVDRASRDMYYTGKTEGIFSFKFHINFCFQLFSLQAFKEARNVSVFLSLDTEIDTEPIVRRIFENQKKCFVPR